MWGERSDINVFCKYCFAFFCIFLYLSQCECNRFILNQCLYDAWFLFPNKHYKTLANIMTLNLFRLSVCYAVCYGFCFLMIFQDSTSLSVNHNEVHDKWTNPIWSMCLSGLLLKRLIMAPFTFWYSWGICDQKKTFFGFILLSDCLATNIILKMALHTF